MFIDSHCHLNFPQLAADIDGILQRMTAAEVDEALCISVTLPEFPQVLALAERDPRLWASVGVHPDNPASDDPQLEPDSAQLAALASHPRVLAIGETGLDYFRLDEDAPWQRERFRQHIRASRASGKPLVVHTRAAANDTLTLMREESADHGVMHCFTESWEVACAAMDLGFYLSFSGIVTFRNAKELREVALKVPDDRLLIETDAPYLAPVPHRGKTNEPAYVAHVAACLAELRGQPREHIGAVTSANFRRLFQGH